MRFELGTLVVAISNPTFDTLNTLDTFNTFTTLNTFDTLVLLNLTFKILILFILAIYDDCYTSSNF